LDRNEFKRSESGFDANKTNPSLSISIHFRLLWNSYKNNFCRLKIQFIFSTMIPM